MEQVFTLELEISIIEHRLNQLLQLCNIYKVEHFHPILVYNETFWQQTSPKREEILKEYQKEWIGNHPVMSACFFVDYNLLDIIKSIRLTVLSYTRLKFKEFIDLILTSSNYSLAPFEEPFESRLITKLNQITPNQKITVNNELLKVQAANFYREHKNQKDIKLLYLCGHKDLEEIETFLNFLKKIEAQSEVKFLSKLKLDIISNYNSSKYLKKEIFTHLKDSIFHSDFTKAKFSKSTKFDFIFVSNFFNFDEGYFFQKYKDKFYSLYLRPIYVNKDKPEIAGEQIEAFRKYFKDEKVDTKLDLNHLSFEKIFKKVNNEQLLSLLEKFYFIEEGKLNFFPPETINFIFSHTSLLTDNGELLIKEYNQKFNSVAKFLLPCKLDSLFFNPINQRFITRMLQAGSKDSIVIEKAPLDFISLSLTGHSNKVINLKSLKRLIENEKSFGEAFFDLSHTDLMKIFEDFYKKVRIYEFLRRFHIPLLGLSTYLFHKGSVKLKKYLQSHTGLKEIFKDEYFEFAHKYKYSDEIEIAYGNFFVNNLEEYKDLVIGESPDLNTKSVISFLSKCKYNPEIFYKFLDKIFERLLILNKNEEDLSIISMSFSEELR